MALHRLAKDNGSVTSGGCPALYSTEDPARMIGQGKVLGADETAELLELLADETAVAIPTETVFRGVAKYATEHGDDELAGRLEAFLMAWGALMAARIITSLASKEWIALFTGFSRSAYRLEALQHYTDPSEREAFTRFCAGQDPQIDLSWWTAMARTQTAAGKSMSRVRVIIEPPSDYTRFELVAYPVMAAAGDDIRIISVSPGRWPTGIPHEDYWVFDDRDVWVLRYDDAGVFILAELLDDPHAILEHLRWRDAALAQAIPVNDYLGITARRAS